MGKPKLFKFADLKTKANVFERDGLIKGRWRSDYFRNDAAITLELACGKGEYTRGLAAIFPDRNFIGMDIKGNRLWTAVNLAQGAGLGNVAFIRDQIDHLEDYFEPGKIDEIWITFADPFRKHSQRRKRLTSSKFLDIYRKVLRPGGRIHLKTDSDLLFDFTLETLEGQKCTIHALHRDIYGEGVTDKTFGIRTHYEKMHLERGLTIKYLCFSLED